MGSAIWLFKVLPQWYFDLITASDVGWYSLIPLAGTVCLGVGVVLGVIRRQPRLFLFFVPFFISQFYVALAGLLRGEIARDSSLAVATVPFLSIELLAVGILIYLLKGARPAATLIALFCVTYALFAAFVGGMAFTDEWL